jgi:hypothetical protein
MDTISLEEIEQMEDFIFRLSENQMKEWKENLKIKQPYIFHIFTKQIFTNKKTDEDDFMFRMIFLVLKCFDAYGVEFPKFTEKDNLKWDTKWKTMMATFGVGGNHREHLMKVAATVNQEVISTYIYDKFVEKDKPSTQLAGNKTGIKYNTLNVMVLMYANKIDEILKQQDKPKPKE